LNTADLTITDDSKNEGLKITTFNGLLKYNKFPFSEMLTSLLQIISGEMNCAVEIEFAAIMNSDNQNKMQCSLLQVRPILRKNEQLIQPIGEINKTGTLFFSENTLGNGVYNNINDIIFVKPENFSSMKTHEIAREIEILNSKMRTEGRYYVLAGPGRWGTADPFLGIPVKWTHISNACLIVEQSIDNFDIEPSQGTHFFHNLTSFGVGYMSIRNSQGFANIKLLRQLHPMSETEYIIHFRVPTDLIILINGLQKKGIINLEL
jgi:hypothetical protein